MSARRPATALAKTAPARRRAAAAEAAPAAADPAASGFRLEQSPFYWLTRAYGGYQRTMTLALRRVGIDSPAWRVLMILSEFEPASVSTLAECAATPSSTMVKAVQRMEADGLVASAPSPADGRVTEVRLTGAGRAKLAEVHEVAGRIYRRIFAGRSDAEVDRLIGDLRAVVTRLDEA